METKPKSKRGFASMTPEKRAAISSIGGKRAHALGRAHKWKAGEEARAAGSRGGKATKSKSICPACSCAMSFHRMGCKLS